MNSLFSWLRSLLSPARLNPAADPGSAWANGHPVTITVDTEHPGPVVPEDFTGLSFERGALNPGNAGVTGYLFSPENSSLVTLFRNIGLRNLRVGGGSVDSMIPVGTGSDGFAGVDALFTFAAAAQVKVIYTFRLLNPGDNPVADLASVNAQAAGYIWQHYRPSLASFAIGNEPDWRAYHTYADHPVDPAIYQTDPAVPGSAYASYLDAWQSFAAAIVAQAPGAPFSGPDTGDYTTQTYTPDPEKGVSWTEQFAGDEQGSGRIVEVTQHHYVGGGPGETTAGQAISNMLSAEWVNGTEPGTQPVETTYTPYPWFSGRLTTLAAYGLRCRFTEANDYLAGVPGASDAFASALWALDYLHWWAVRAVAGVNFHNKQWLRTGTIVPGPSGDGFAITPKGYAIKAFALGSRGLVEHTQIENADGINLTAYGIGEAGEHYVTVINKTQGAEAADASVTIPVPPGPLLGVEVMRLLSGQPGDATATSATLGGAAITGDVPWAGEWSPVYVGWRSGIRLIVPAASAAVVRIRLGAQDPD
jgi:hypothetical protein